MTASLVVVVTGARGADVPEELVTSVLSTVAPDELILGDCPSGVDVHAWTWAEAQGVSNRVHFADWTKHGYAAGPKRNEAMIADAVARRAAGAEVIVLAFPRGGPGTTGCIALAEAAGLPVELF